jgi:hypothetical protein
MNLPFYSMHTAAQRAFHPGSLRTESFRPEHVSQTFLDHECSCNSHTTSGLQHYELPLSCQNRACHLTHSNQEIAKCNQVF